MKKIAIANDHGGLELKQAIMKHFKKTYEFVDCGTYSLDSCDYPDFAIKAGELVRDRKVDFGIVICKSGIGMSIAANKVKDVRCARIDSIKDAKLTRSHNDANVLAISSELNFRKTKRIIETFINTEFSNDERHVKRIEMISKYEH